MRNILTIDLDDERQETVLIGKPLGNHPTNQTELHDAIRLDIATLCEGLVTLIHIAESQGVRTSAESLRLCIEHLTAGFADADFKVRLA